MCLPWQHWTKALVWCDDVNISAFHSCVVVDLWQSLSEWREKVGRKRPEIFANNSWILHHDNAPAHTALSVREFLATKQITVLEHPAYSPDQPRSDFFLFPKIKEILKGRHFDDIDDIRSNTTAALKAIPQNQFQIVLKGGLRAGIGA